MRISHNLQYISGSFAVDFNSILQVSNENPCKLRFGTFLQHFPCHWLLGRLAGCVRPAARPTVCLSVCYKTHLRHPLWPKWKWIQRKFIFKSKSFLSIRWRDEEGWLAGWKFNSFICRFFRRVKLCWQTKKACRCSWWYFEGLNGEEMERWGFIEQIRYWWQKLKGFCLYVCVFFSCFFILRSQNNVKIAFYSY